MFSTIKLYYDFIYNLKKLDILHVYLITTDVGRANTCHVLFLSLSLPTVFFQLFSDCFSESLKTLKQQKPMCQFIGDICFPFLNPHTNMTTVWGNVLVTAHWWDFWWQITDFTKTPTCRIKKVMVSMTFVSGILIHQGALQLITSNFSTPGTSFKPSQ